MEIKKPSFENKDERGLFQEVLNDPNLSWTTLNRGSMKAGSIVGNHYHKKTKAFVFLIKGKAKVIVENVTTGERETGILDEGTGILLNEYHSHAIQFLTDAEFITLKTKYDPKSPDTYKHKVL